MSNNIKPNICDTDLCTSEIDDGLLYNSGLIDSVIPATDNMSAELSELMKETTGISKEQDEIFNFINKKNKSIDYDDNDDISRLFRLVKHMKKELSYIKEECNIPEIISRLNSKANKSDLSLLNNKINDIEKIISNCLGDCNYESNTRGFKKYNKHHHKYKHKPEDTTEETPMDTPKDTPKKEHEHEYNHEYECEHNHEPYEHEHNYEHNYEHDYEPTHCGHVNKYTKKYDDDLCKYIDYKICEKLDPLMKKIDCKLEKFHEKIEHFDKKHNDMKRMLVLALRNAPVKC